MPRKQCRTATNDSINEDSDSFNHSERSQLPLETRHKWYRSAKGAPSNDVGWCYGEPTSKNRHTIKCLACDKIVTGGVTRFKEHIAGKRGQVTACPNIDPEMRKQMRAHLEEGKAARNDKKQRRRELEEQLRSRGVDNDETDEDVQISSFMHGSAENRGGARENENVDEGRRKWIDLNSPDAQLRSRDYLLQRSHSSKQLRVDKAFLAKRADKLGEAWAKFIIYNRLPFHVVSSPWSQQLIDVAAEVGKGVKNPTPYQLSEVYLKREHEEMKQWIDSFKGIWKERGVTIMCDGWTSLTRKHIINFLVYCNRGTVFHHSIDASDVPSRTAEYYFGLMDAVVEEIGEENVVQVVTDNEAAMKAGGRLLMEKRKHLYWTACAAHCIDLMLGDIGKKSNVENLLNESKVITSFIYNHTWVLDYMKKYTAGRELLRPAVTRFATNFIAVESICRYRTQLQEMMRSDGWKCSKWGKMKSGPAYEAKKIIMGSSFWRRAQDILKVHEPLVKVLRLVDGDEKPTIGFVYEAMDRAKRAIRRDCRYWQEYWDIIDRRWGFQLHHDLHAAGYYLNPQFLYSENTSTNCMREVMKGLRDVIAKLEPDIDKQIRAINQVEMYRHKEETFGTQLAQKAVMQTSPAEWWINFGTCAPELQQIAVKVLSQTASSSNCERNWSTFQFIHTKTRNRLKYKKLQKLVFLHYNMRLKLRHTMRKSREDIEASFNPINLDYIFEEDDPLHPWLEERESPLLDGREDNEWLYENDYDDDDNDNENDDEEDNEDEDDNGDRITLYSQSPSPATMQPENNQSSSSSDSSDNESGGDDTTCPDANDENREDASNEGHALYNYDDFQRPNMSFTELLSSFGAVQANHAYYPSK